jgi:deoxyribonuclease-4
MEHYRVRQLLSLMDSTARASLKKLLPKKLVMPDVATGKYPSAILTMLPKDECYSLLGCIAEDLLRLPPTDITLTSLHAAILSYYPDYTDAQKGKIAKSKTTQPFLDHIVATRVKLDAVVQGALVFDTVVRYEAVEGHPDAQTETQLFEVKLTGMLKKNWVDFLFQVFAYAALHAAATDVYLVLPLQDTVWHQSVTAWTGRTAYRDFLNALSKAHQEPTAGASPIPGMLLQESHSIGCHVQKMKTVALTLTGLQQVNYRPYQMFLTGPQNTKIIMKDEDLAAAAAAQQESAVRMYVHSPYVINLCHEPGTKEDYGVVCLQKNLQYADTMGLKGVVVHVGKSTDMPLAVALEHMRKNILKAMEVATEACPILLETPAGQGSETLTTYDDFVTFVHSFNSPKLRICVDTCHVFATGQNPFEYIQKMMTLDPTLLKLVHFNDSATPCGSCLDRHAFIGTGKIGYAALKEIADYCMGRNVPMLVE